MSAWGCGEGGTHHMYAFCNCACPQLPPCQTLTQNTRERTLPGMPRAVAVLTQSAIVLAVLVAHGAAQTPTDEPEDNPFKDSADTTNECYTWAADGQCVANPDYMTSSCKYSCWEWFEYRRKKYPDAPM